MHMSLRHTLLPLVISLPIALLLTGCRQDSKPDIEAGSLAVAPAAPVPTVQAVVSLPVSNTGDKDAGEFAWTVRRDGAYNFATGTVPGLAQGASTVISFTVLEATASTHTYQVILNSNNNFQESNLENNTATAAIGFGPTAVDPQVTALVMTTPNPGPPFAADSVVLTATVVSPLTAINTVTDLQWTVTGVAVLNFDPTQTIPTAPISGVILSIVPGGSASPTIGVGQLDPLYSYTFTFTVTPGITNTDTDTTNNAATTPIIAPLPAARAQHLVAPSDHNLRLTSR